MKSTNVKTMVAKVMTVGLLAGAFVMAAPAKADAQQFGAVVEVGYPHLDYSRRDYFERQRIEQERRAEFERREAIRRHEEWARMHRYDRGWR
jgi:Ni/Co efflux regulator RcnB